MRRHLFSTVVVTAVLTFAPAVAVGQDEIILSGTISDSLDGTLLSGVDIYLGETGFVGSTDASGAFRVAVSDSGPHVLGLSRVGYRPRLFELTIPSDVGGTAPIGELVLVRGEADTRRLVGSVRDSSDGDPIAAAFVTLNGRMAAVTDQQGQFAVTVGHAVEGINRVSIRRIGFRPVDLNVMVSAGEAPITIDAALERLPIQLEEIVVEADRVVMVSGRLAEFYRRRKVGHGRYLTAEEIEKTPAFQVTDLFRRFAGVRVVSNPTDSFDKRIVIGRSSMLCSGTLVYLDGISLPPGWSVDWMTQPEYLAGVEIYSGPAQIPPQYNRTGNACGVVLLWSK